MNRRALTLLELLVVLSICCLLAAILLPAVQRLREQGRAIQCRNHLKQFGLALQNYHADNGMFPTALPATSSGAHVYAHAHVAPHVRLLPYLEYSHVFNAVNFEFPYDGSPFDGWSTNTTAYIRPVQIFLCPSDPSRSGPFPGNNYRVSLGPVGWEIPDPYGGMFGAFVWYSTRDITDGLSFTSAGSERARGDHDKSRIVRGDYWYGSFDWHAVSADAALEACRLAARPPHAHESTAGVTWFHAGFHSTWYNHVAPPNNDTDCTAMRPTDSHNFRRGVFSASSHHSGGVHVLFADGHVQFVTTAVDLLVWRAVGSRQGSETMTKGDL